MVLSQLKKSFPPLVSEIVYPIFLRVQQKLYQLYKTNTSTQHDAKFQKQSTNCLFKKKTTNWKHRRNALVSKKCLRIMKVFILPIKNHLLSYGTYCSRSCVCVQEEFEYEGAYDARTSKISTSTKYHVKNSFAWKRNKQNFICQS